MDRAPQVNAGDRPGAALADPAINPDHDRRKVACLFHPCGHDANDARMPALSCGPGQARIGPRLDLGQGLVTHRGLDGAAVAVQHIQFRRQPAGLSRVAAGQAQRAQIGPAHAAARIDARTQQEAQVEGARGAVKARYIRQGHQAGALSAGHDGQALPHKGAVDANQRGHIGHGRKRHQIQHRHQVRLGPSHGAQHATRLHQRQEHHACGAEVAQRSILVRAVGVHDGQGRGQGLAAQVVVKHDDVGACRSRQGLMAQRAAIDADDQVVVFRQGRHGGGIRAITFVDAVGNIQRGILALTTQPVQQQRSRGAAVHVVIGKDGNAFAVDGRRHQPFRRNPHVAQGQRVGQQLTQARCQKSFGAIRLDPSFGQDARDGQGQAGALGQPFRQAVRRAVRADPPPICQRLLDSQKRHGSTFFFIQISWGEVPQGQGAKPPYLIGLR